MKVKIKTWERMEREYGSYGDIINCVSCFSKELEAALPKDRVITVSRDGGRCEYIWRNYCISNDMIARVISEKKADARYFFSPGEDGHTFLWYYPTDGTSPRVLVKPGWTSAYDDINAPAHKEITKKEFLKLAKGTRGWREEVRRNPWLEEVQCEPKWAVKHTGRTTSIRKDGIKGKATWDGTGRECRLMGLLVAALKALGATHNEIEQILKDSERAYIERHTNR